MGKNTFFSRIKNAWNAFFNRDPPEEERIFEQENGISYSYRPDRPHFTRGNEKSIVTSIFNRIAIDGSSISIRHVETDELDRVVKVLDTSLNNCLTIEANADQTGRAFIQDVIMSLLDEGCVAIVPVDTDVDPNDNGSFDILTMRTGKILEWYPDRVKIHVYNELNGRFEDITLPKRAVGIVESPLYSIINEPNSTLKRLIRKLNILDAIDEQSGSGKLDLIIQLPYTVKSDLRKNQAESRRGQIEDQLVNSKYGIAYVDSTEHITQLNRPVGNNLMTQIEYLTSMLYSQLGITQSVLDGTADEKTMLNYENKTVEPIVSAIVDEMKRKFLTKTARTQRKTIVFFRDPFKLVPVNQIAEIADKLTRNEIMTSNEIRSKIGLMPSKDPNADVLRNKNLSQSSKEKKTENDDEESSEGNQNG